MIKKSTTIPTNASYSIDCGCSNNNAKLRDEDINISWTIDQLMDELNRITVKLNNGNPLPDPQKKFVVISPNK